MHCMDGDYTGCSILPPHNTIHAQLVDAQGNLVITPGSITATYKAGADADRSINTSSIGKTGFWDFVLDLFGASPAPGTGLAGFEMPGASNTPQAMRFDSAQKWFTAEGIPITPYDDAGHKNAYPMMRLTARDGSGVVLATTDVVLPVSDETDRTACHASGSASDARPSGGCANRADPQVDYRLNLLLLHDERRDNRMLSQQTVAAAGYSALGLYDQPHNQGKPVLCAACRPSNALPGTGQPGTRPLTHSVHSVHDIVVDPATDMTLGNSANRSAC